MTKADAVEDIKINHMKLLTIIVLVFVAGYLIEKIIDRSNNFNEPPGNYLMITAQLLTVFVSLSIFSITWIASDRNLDNHSLFLGFTFLIIGLLNLFHIFSYPSMPGFFTPNSPNKADFFLIESRTFLALLFLASVYIHKDTSPKLINKFVLMSFSLALSVISVSFVILYNDLFSSYDFSGFARTSGSYFFIITVIILYASYLYARRSKETGEKDLVFLIYGIIMIIFSNLFYTSFEYSGTFLMITGYYFIYFGLYKSSVIMPYENLAMAEERLHRASEEKYSNLIDNANDAIITTDLENRITGWNKAAEKLFGWTAYEVSGKIFSSLLVPDNNVTEDSDKRDGNALNGMISNSMETVRLRKDGTKIDVSLTISPILNEDKKIIGLFDIIRDITERRLAEKRLKEANIELMRADELKTQFLSIISHELRTPITPMNAQLQMMLAGYFGELTEKQINSLKMIQRNTARLDGLIGDVLDISKLEAGVMKFNIVPANINEIVENAVDIMKVEASNKNLKLALIEEKVPEIKLDKDRITQVMMDLLNNAIKFTDAGGDIEVGLTCDNKNVTVKVKDSGIGIKKEDIDKLFKPFQQLDTSPGRKYEGTGLGLAICKKIILNHGGKIWAESEFRKGTAIYFTIPFVSE